MCQNVQKHRTLFLIPETHTQPISVHYITFLNIVSSQKIESAFNKTYFYSDEQKHIGVSGRVSTREVMETQLSVYFIVLHKSSILLQCLHQLTNLASEHNVTEHDFLDLTQLFVYGGNDNSQEISHTCGVAVFFRWLVVDRFGQDILSWLWP